MDTCYAPLRLQSNWSLLRGASPLEAYLEQAARWGLPALALTDGNLFGAVPFFEGARRFGIKPILGATVKEGEAGAWDLGPRTGSHVQKRFWHDCDSTRGL